MQQFTYLKGGEDLTIWLPGADTQIIGEARWGDPCALFTPAYWYTQYVMRDLNMNPARHRIGQTFAEELAACLLGGHGITGELGNAAFERVKQEGLIRDLCDDAAVFEKLLCEPLQIGSKWIRYRFWKQKARYLATAFRHLQFSNLPLDDAVELRNRLMTLPGIGPKTASWTVRNWMNSDEVAILDIHIVRAGMLMKLYCRGEHVERHYLEMEAKFVKLATMLAVPTSDLDALIWSMMRTTPRLVARLLDEPRLRAPSVQPVREGRARTRAT